MRSKEQILDDSLRAQATTPVWDRTISKHEELTIEVLIDIRDILQQRLISLDNTILKYAIPK